MLVQVIMNSMIIFMLSLPALAAAKCNNELIGITVFFYSHGDEWSMTWKADGVHKEKTDYYANLKEGYRTNKYDSFRSERAERLPQKLLSPDKEFNLPFDISQNGELMIAAIYKKTGVISPSKQLAIVDLKKKKVIRIIETKHDIRSLSWAPDGKYFVVLYQQDVTEHVLKGPLDWLAHFLGHPISYWTFYLTLYQPDGMPVCTEEVAEKLPDAMSYINWGKQ